MKERRGLEKKDKTISASSPTISRKNRARPERKNDPDVRQKEKKKSAEKIQGGSTPSGLGRKLTCVSD